MCTVIPHLDMIPKTAGDFQSANCSVFIVLFVPEDTLLFKSSLKPRPPPSVVRLLPDVGLVPPHLLIFLGVSWDGSPVSVGQVSGALIGCSLRLSITVCPEVMLHLVSDAFVVMVCWKCSVIHNDRLQTCGEGTEH